ncbi:MAG: hypothetical protein FIA93_08445 [Deltaproteobacteria bacterium]|nr:hypothetical protein [Deltaproteobacteria bacterium]
MAFDQDDTAPATGDEKVAIASTMPASTCARRIRRPRGTSNPDRRLTQPAGTLSTPRYTAHVGHWSESLVDEAAATIGGNPDRDRLRQLLRETGQEIDILAGRSFGGGGRKSVGLDSRGFPLVEVPDMQRGSLDSENQINEVPDPVNKQMTTVLQLAPLMDPTPLAIAPGDALFVAGQLIDDARRDGRLDGDYVLKWLGHAMEGDERKALLRRVMDPNYRFNVPILGAQIGGWWFQITRRLVWITNETPDEGRMIEPLFDMDEVKAHRLPALCAVEAILIAARLTRQPIDWAFSTRIWTEDVKRPAVRPWRMIAKAIRGFGIPVVTLDKATTRMEIACQVLLKAYWHGYIGNDEPGLAAAIALAYPRQVERVRTGTKAATTEAAAATLLEGLLYPGFDPARGAEANRRYVARKASIAIMEHRKREHVDKQPWTRVGISERRYYKLLRYFAPKVDGRYVGDRDVIVSQMREYLDLLDRARAVRSDLLEALRDRGFSDAAARKWIQRHGPEDFPNARPRKRAA